MGHPFDWDARPHRPTGYGEAGRNPDCAAPRYRGGELFDSRHEHNKFICARFYRAMREAIPVKSLTFIREPTKQTRIKPNF
jgi:hypothetical protein